MKLSILAAAVIGLMIGAVFGVKAGIEFSRSVEDLEPIFLSEATADFAAKQFKHADTTHAREAVLFQIKVLQALQRLGQNRSYEGRLASAYVRLAVIEEAAGQKQAEREALNEARRYFRRLHPAQELTADQMKSALVQMDEVMDRPRL